MEEIGNMRGTQPIITGFEDGKRGLRAKMCRGLLETGEGSELVANKENGSQSNNCKEDHSANSLNWQGNGLAPKVSGFPQSNPFQYSCLKNPMVRGPYGLQSIGWQIVGQD